MSAVECVAKLLFSHGVPHRAMRLNTYKDERLLLWCHEIETVLVRYPYSDGVSLTPRVVEVASKYAQYLFRPMEHADFSHLPGAELIIVGLQDLAHHRETIPALLVMIGSPRLRRSNIVVPVSDEDALNADHRLYRLLEQEHGNDAHSQYNALIRRLVSFERSLHLVSKTIH